MKLCCVAVPTALKYSLLEGRREANGLKNLKYKILKNPPEALKAVQKCRGNSLMELPAYCSQHVHIQGYGFPELSSVLRYTCQLCRAMHSPTIDPNKLTGLLS